MLFYSGMPLCSAVVIIVFAITNLIDRWAVVSLMKVTRYSSELPRLILGEPSFEQYYFVYHVLLLLEMLLLLCYPCSYPHALS